MRQHEQFARRGVRERALDRVYEVACNVADLKTISTALLVMSRKVR